MLPTGEDHGTQRNQRNQRHRQEAGLRNLDQKPARQSVRLGHGHCGSGAVLARLLQGEGQVAHTVPAWLIPGVASLDITVAGAHMPMAWAPEVNLLAMAVGSMLALVLAFLTVAIAVLATRTLQSVLNGQLLST